MGDYSGYSRGVKVAILCTIWFCLSSSNNVIIKRLLSDYPYPITVSLSHMTSTAFLMYPVLFGFGVKTTVDIPILRFYVLLIPLGIGKILVSISSHVSIWRIPVSYAHTGLSCLAFCSKCYVYKQQPFHINVTRSYVSIFH